MKFREQIARLRSAKRLAFVRPRVEELESRWNPSFTAAGPTLRLELVVFHEFGHALGLEHTSSAYSIMNPTYNAEYDFDYFLSGQDPAVADLQSLYSAGSIANGNSPWSDLFDSNPGDNVIQISYSFVLDSPGASSLFEVMNSRFGSPGVWQGIFGQMAGYWSAASGGVVDLACFGEETEAMEGNPGRGQLRIGAGPIDGPGGVLALGSRTFINFDADEAWGDPLPVVEVDEDAAGGDFGDALMGPVVRISRGVSQPMLVIPLIAPSADLTAVFEAAREVRTLTVQNDLVPGDVIQFRVAQVPSQVPNFIVTTANPAWAQHTQANLQTLVFLPATSQEASAAETALPDVLSPREQNDARPDSAGPVMNDAGPQTQTLQVPQVDSESSHSNELNPAAVDAVFDSGTALSGLALMMGGYWAVPQEEERNKKQRR